RNRFAAHFLVRVNQVGRVVNRLLVCRVTLAFGYFLLLVAESYERSGSVCSDATREIIFSNKKPAEAGSSFLS
ncbi:hypothetical protein, partial [Cronobacter sakazakii]|uniref:hypothetical protein n=1 Tax=Cronobacter sakazakii TaxID=28141 RepID=UPI001ED96A12